MESFMDKKYGIFISTPISGFSDENEYNIYREFVLKLIRKLRECYSVCSEVEQITDFKSYDSPGKSIVDDFKSITNNDIFLFLHPSKMQTSSLIELGYAVALNKRILIVGRREDLPYLAIGLKSYSNKTIIIDTPVLSDKTIDQIFCAVHSLIEISN